ncbi:MAG: tRNA lysidine(34) synthetase TilS [Rothia sp. (in: high G+C Gram-positive bacteria)]|nr:tRNA lysidine(34) synthetase TilS [Rothia sp. (in: high G+C Gram-positive bacteria)]
MQKRKTRLNPLVGSARRQVAQVLNQVFGPGQVAPTGTAASLGPEDQAEQLPLILAAVSGGPDSLALAALLAHFNRRKDLRVGAIVVDHQLQPASSQVAERTVQLLNDLGLAPVLLERVTVEEGREGPEMAARKARYGAFARALAATGASAIALGHTLDDQAETVLLGLARGSGTRSLAGMPLDRVEEHPAGPLRLIRPLLQLRRRQIEEICAAEGLEPWYDPTNNDQSLMRARVRHRILPYLEEHLGGDVALSLARTAAITGADADYLSSAAQQAFSSLLIQPQDLAGLGPDLTGALGLGAGEPALLLDRQALLELHPALRYRVLALALEEAGGLAASFERLSALDHFVQELPIAGPLELPGHLSAYRRRPACQLQLQGQRRNLKKTGLIVLLKTSPSTILKGN